MRKGLFITLEGTEGAGKSTLVPVLKDYLSARGRQVLTVREPGGTGIAENIRTILKTVNHDESLTPAAELLLMYAARSQLVERVIRPALSEGVDVISDRHDLSTLAYQGGGRGLPLDEIKAVRQVALGSFKPDVTLLLDIDPVAGMRRARSRGALDRFEQEQTDFFTRVRNTYLACAAADPSIHVIDAARDLEAVADCAKQILDGFIHA